jgi:hypothetical protein
VDKMPVLQQPDGSWHISLADGTIHGSYPNARNMALHFLELIEKTNKKDELVAELIQEVGIFADSCLETIAEVLASVGKGDHAEQANKVTDLINRLSDLQFGEEDGTDAESGD